MRLPAVVLVACLLPSGSGCSDSSPIDPDDPLIGQWALASPGGTISGHVVWVFGGNGYYRFDPDGDGGGLEEGAWERIDSATITRCKRNCGQAVQSQVRIETADVLQAMMIDGLVAVDGTWTMATQGICHQHGGMIRTRGSDVLRPDGTVHATEEFCNGSPQSPLGSRTCEGTWSSNPPFGISVMSPCDVWRAFRVGDMIGPTGFLRVDPP